MFRQGEPRRARSAMKVRAAAAVVVVALAAVSAGQAGAQGGGEPIDAEWLSRSLASSDAPAKLQNNLRRGALARRDRAMREWRSATRRHARLRARARKARGTKRRRLLAQARRAAPDPYAKPEYVVVWSGNQNGADLNGAAAQEELGRFLAGDTGGVDDAGAKFAPGLDAWVVLDARRRNPDGSRNATYGKVVNFVQVPLPWGVEGEPHHMQYQWEPGQPLLAGGLFNDTTFVLDVGDIPRMSLKNTITPEQTPNGSVPDAYDYAGDGRFIGTYMGGPQTNFAGSPGEVVAFRPDRAKGLTVASEVAGGVPGARQTGNPGGIPEPCNEEEAAPLDTCSNPHGVQVRPDLNTMVTSDYAEPRHVVIDPVKPAGGASFRPTVRVWDTSNPDRPKLESVAHMPSGWRGARKNTMGANRGVMEAAKTWPASSRFPGTLPSKGAFAGAMCGGGIFFTPDMTALPAESSRNWKQVWDDGIALLRARRGNVDDFIKEPGPCEGGSWMQVSRNNRWLFRVAGGNAPNEDNTTGTRQPVKVVYDLDVQALMRSAAAGRIQCDLTRGIDTNGDRRVDITAVDAVRRLADGDAVADCPRLIDTLKVDDDTTGGPHWGAIDNHSVTPEGFPTRLAFSDYFVSRSGVDGNHRLYMVDVDPASGKLSYERRWRDEVTGELGTNFNRDDWPGNPGAGWYKPHSMVWVCPPGVCAKDTDAQPTRTTPPSETTTSSRFDGSCSFIGALKPERPYGLFPASNNPTADATGTCTGTLNGKPFDGPARLWADARMDRPMTCLATASHMYGHITFGDPADLDAPQLGVFGQEVQSLSEMNWVFLGAYNGKAHGRWRLRSDPIQTTETCARAELDSVPFSLDIRTIQTLYG